jgi:hypothetical protein
MGLHGLLQGKPYLFLHTKIMLEMFSVVVGRMFKSGAEFIFSGLGKEKKKKKKKKK